MFGVLRSDDTVLVAIDLQSSFLRPVDGAQAVLRRAIFLAECARLLGVPTIATEQYPERMGGLDPALATSIGEAPIVAKRRFSCCGVESFDSWLDESNRMTAVITGIETHICVSQTALDLLERGWRVAVVADAVSCRSSEAHATALVRLRDAGAEVAPAESVVYEWMRSADHPQFAKVLSLVKESANF